MVLSWDTLSVASFDRFSQEFDFEGYRLYKGTDPLLTDARVVTDINGTPTFYRPIAQWDLDNGITGPVSVLSNTASYDLGSDSGLEFSYIDTDVRNGVTYYYALVAYDRGFSDGDSPPVDPQENTFSIVTDLAGQVRTTSANAVAVTPRSTSPGFVDADVNEDLSAPTAGPGTGSISVEIVDASAVDPNSLYRISFFEGPGEIGDIYETASYEITNQTTGEVLVVRRPISPTTPVADGFVVTINNELDVALDPERTGWVEGLGTGSPQYSLDPRELDTYTTDWVATVGPDNTDAYVPTADDYELRWVDPNGPEQYTPPRIGGTIFGDPLPIIPYNVSRDSTVDLAIFDLNDNDEVDAFDEFVIYERPGGVGARRYRYRVSFDTTASVPPSAGDVLRLTNRKPFGDGAFFEFTLRAAGTDADAAREGLARISVVPNPYVIAAEWERRTQTAGRGERKIEFTNLPQSCTIRIFNLRGELLKTIEHTGRAGDGSASWDLRTEENLEVAYGIYFFHVEAPGLGEHTGRFAVVK